MGKILFIRGGAVGDFILTLPAIKLVRDSLPDNEIEILGYPSITEVAIAGGIADRTRSIESAKLATFFVPGAKLDDEWVDYLKSFDVVISYLFDPDGHFCGNLERIGVQTLISGPFKMNETLQAKPAPQQLAEPLEQLALFLDKDYVEIEYNGTQKRSNPTVAIHPGSGSPSKNWSINGWAELTERIRDKQPDVQFLISSGEAEYETICEFVQLLKAADIAFEHLTDLSLVELAKQIAGCQFYLGNDSGVGHLAATTGVPGLILFGASQPHVWAPRHPAMNHLVAPDQQLGLLSAKQILEDSSLSEFFTFPRL